MSTSLSPLFTWRSAITESDLSATEKHVALALSLYMNERGGSAYPGPTRLSEDTGRHVVTVKRALAAIVEAGWLELVRRGGASRGGRRTANEYRARTPDREHRTTGSAVLPVAGDTGSVTHRESDAREPGASRALTGSVALPQFDKNTSLKASGELSTVSEKSLPDNVADLRAAMSRHPTTQTGETA